MYDFNTQLDYGEKQEDELYQYFDQDYIVTKTNLIEQKKGIDAYLENKFTGKKVSVEIKSDKAASSTGNAFIETVSVDTKKTPGWAYTSQAEYLIYHLPLDKLFYIIKFTWIRKKLDFWRKNCRTRTIPNRGYNTVGLLLPLYFFEQEADNKNHQVWIRGY